MTERKRGKARENHDTKATKEGHDIARNSTHNGDTPASSSNAFDRSKGICTPPPCFLQLLLGRGTRVVRRHKKCECSRVDAKQISHKAQQEGMVGSSSSNFHTHRVPCLHCSKKSSVLKRSGDWLSNPFFLFQIGPIAPKTDQYR
jgi:hypothetical protein